MTTFRSSHLTSNNWKYPKLKFGATQVLNICVHYTSFPTSTTFSNTLKFSRTLQSVQWGVNTPSNPRFFTHITNCAMRCQHPLKPSPPPLSCQAPFPLKYGNYPGPYFLGNDLSVLVFYEPPTLELDFSVNPKNIKVFHP